VYVAEVDRVIRSYFNDRDSLRPISREELLEQSYAGVVTVLACAARLRFRNAYNLTAMSITPAELAVEIRKHVPEFAIDYRVDPVRQSIADTWPHSFDASVARQDWNFSPWYDLAAMTADMHERLGARINARKIGA
jgi:nucleoside-diphosphate-sugar epimerase